jgi:hypothetical protein
MTGRWPFKKTDAGASSSSTSKKKGSPLKKEQNRSYMNVEIVQALYDQNASVGLRDIHLPGGWHLNAKRVPVLPVPRRGQERRAIVPPDLREDPAFAMDSEWWDRPAYEPCPRRRSGLLSNAEYDYAAKVYPQQQAPY